MSAPMTIKPATVSRALRRSFFFIFAAALFLMSVGTILFLRFAGYILVAPESIPQHADVAVVLQGGVGETRLAEAIHLLQQGRVDHVMVSVGRQSFLGEWLPDLLSHYVDKLYGKEVALHVVLCELSGEVDSTSGEALILRHCLEARQWRSLIVVTSNYHTRRAGQIWRATLTKDQSPFTLSLHGVSDGDFEPRGWWRRRRYAKTWLLEFTKLVWNALFA